MELYRSDYLSIKKEKGTLIQQWSDRILSPEKFKEELSIFADIGQQESHKSHLWLHENFKLNIPPSLYQWLEDSVTSVLHKNGLRKVAFTVSSEVKSHLSVVNSFSQIQSVANPLFFVDDNEAMEYIQSKDEVTDFVGPSSPDYKVNLGKDPEFATFEVKTHINDLPRLLCALDSIKSENQLVASEIEKFRSLTYREREVMRYISLGLSNQEIASEMFLSLNTIKNHRKNIICKLQISSAIDFHHYAKAFRLIHF